MTRRTTLLLALPMVTMLTGAPCSESPVLQVTNLDLVESKRLSRTLFAYSYRLDVMNSGPDATAVEIELVSAGPGTTVVEGRARLPLALSGSTERTVDTITIEHDRSVAFDPTLLRWRFSSANQLPLCSSLSVSAEEMELIVREEVDTLIAAGRSLTGSALDNPIEFDSILSRIEERLACRSEYLAPVMGATSMDDTSFARASVSASSYVPSVRYCGPGWAVGVDFGFGDVTRQATGVDGLNPRTSDCFNHACFEHDSCYGDRCIAGRCAFSRGGQAEDCDLAFFGDTSDCIGADPIVGFWDSFVFATAGYLASLSTGAGVTDACSNDADRCDASEDEICEAETCDGRDNDCNGFTDDTIRVSGAWAGTWSDELENAGTFPDVSIEQVGTLIRGTYRITGTSPTSGRFSGSLACGDADVAGSGFGFDPQGGTTVWRGSFGECAALGSFDAFDSSGSATGSGQWSIARVCE